MTTRRFNRYPAYRDSGVEWLGEIPAHWEVKRLRFVSESNPVPSEVRGLPGDTEVSFVPMEAVGEHGGLSLETTKRLADVKAGHTYFRDGDIVIAKITPCFENGKGALAAGLANGIAFGTTELHVLRTIDRADRRFMFYLTLSDAFRRLGEADMYGAGGQKRVSESFVRNFSLAIPYLPEQRAIAAFLDRETARIDALVAKKERLIALLQEQRTALITRAVTKGLPAEAAAKAGLDQTVPMKDSGVEWLGEIPAHWEVKRLRHISPSLGVGVVVNPSSYVTDEGLPFLYGSDISEGQIHVAEARRISRLNSRRLPKSELRPGDLVMVRVGAPGVTAVVPPELDGANCASLLVIRRNGGIESSWLCYALNSRYVRSQVGVVQYGAAQEQFNVSHAVNFLVAVPPRPEQDAIAAFLDRETTRIDALVAKVRDAIERLKELRTALISAAVTGKIDVRAASAEAAAGQGGAP